MEWHKCKLYTLITLQHKSFRFVVFIKIVTIKVESYGRDVQLYRDFFQSKKMKWVNTLSLNKTKIQAETLNNRRCLSCSSCPRHSHHVTRALFLFMAHLKMLSASGMKYWGNTLQNNKQQQRLRRSTIGLPAANTGISLE